MHICVYTKYVCIAIYTYICIYRIYYNVQVYTVSIFNAFIFMSVSMENMVKTLI